LLQS
jgi:hypothetical protein